MSRIGNARLNLLTASEVKKAKPKKKPFQLYDGGGLMLLVKETGSKGWRYKFRFAGKERRMSLGPYPAVSLAKAREYRREVELQVIDSLDPVDERRKKLAAEKAKLDADKLTFSSLVWKWSDKYHNGKGSAATTKKRNDRLLKYLEVDLGNVPVMQITHKAVLKSVERIQDDNGTETAHRCLTFCHLFCEHLVINGLISGDPTVGIRGELAEIIDKPRAAIIDEKGIGHLLRSIWNYEGQPATVAALKLLAHTFLRSAELRNARWQEIDFDAAEWIVPAVRMTKRKKPAPHFVPLTAQTLTILKELHMVTGRGPDSFIFPSTRKGRPLSENCFKVALANMGITGDIHQPHGFRKTAATRLAALGYSRHMIKMQSSRVDSSVEAIYDLYDHKQERIAMMRQWGSYLDQLRQGANVVAIGKMGAA